MNETMSWRQVGGNQFEAEVACLSGWYVWVSDGVLGYARPLAEHETVEQAVAHFEAAGEPAEEVRVYQDGQPAGEFTALSKVQDGPDVEGGAWICGVPVQIDVGGGCWGDVEGWMIPYTIREEIEAEMIEGRRETCDDFLASNGLHYRWSEFLLAVTSPLA